MRRLIYVPIVHTAADMGSQAGALEREYRRRGGRAEWLRTRRLIERLWDAVRERLLALELDYGRVRIYQDGLPVCGLEMEIARDVAAKGSRNYALVGDLLERGATMEGTEDPALLVEEWLGLRRISEARGEAARRRARAAYARDSPRLLQERDAFIARRIDATLKDGEVGILLLGLLHQVDRLLAPDIAVEYLVPRLPPHRSSHPGPKIPGGGP
jgi:hypothetical protein